MPLRDLNFSLRRAATGPAFTALPPVARARSLLRDRFPGRSSDLPVLLGISFPKSGTHLLEQILIGFSRVTSYSKRPLPFYVEYEGDTGLKRPPESAMNWLDNLRPGHVATAHLFARPEIVRRVDDPRFAPYFIFRDPRDVVVSHVFFVTDMYSPHAHHEYYASLPDFHARLAVSILGRPDTDIEFPDIGKRFEPFQGWLDQPHVLPIRFEELIHQRDATLGGIADHLRARASVRASRETVVDALAKSIDPTRAPTFRSGRTGEWRRYFTDEHKALFKDVAGDLLIRLGYERDHNW